MTKRADPAAPNMGLTTWRGVRVRKADAGIAKNYLVESEIAELNRLTTMFLDFAEDRAARRQQTLMSDWLTQPNRFLNFNERPTLNDAGAVSAADAERLVAHAYADFDERRQAKEADDAALGELEDLGRLLEP